MLRKPFLLYEEPDGGSGSSGGGDPKTYSEDEFKKVVNQRQELKDKLGEYESKVNELSEKIKSFENADLEKKGELEKILQNTKSELETIKKERDTFKQKADEWDGFLTSKREGIKEKLGDKWKESFTNLPLSDLEELADTLIKKVPDTDGGGGSPPTALTESEKAEAKRMGLDEEAYKRYKEKRKSLKGE